MEKIPAKYARRQFTAVRDDHGVPHVEAASWPEALYALGYLHALDRPTQMLFSRTMAEGRAAELIANTAELVETDRFFRRSGLYLELDREVRALDDHIFEQLTVYSEGVNDGMKDAGRSLPMWATRFHPEPWNQHAVMLIGVLLSFGGLAVSQQQNERLLMELIQLGVDEARMKELFAPALDGADFELLRQVKMSSQLSDEALELIADLPRLAGSNAWAVRGERTASGHAVLASDPHLEVNRLPAIWYEVALHWRGDYLMGATLPGCPLPAVARTRRLAWGVTYMKGDTCDYFVEDCRPGGATGWQYRRGNRWYDFHMREEVIHRKGTENEVLLIYENDEGILESDPEEQGAGYYLSMRWTGRSAGTGRSIGTWLEVAAAGSTAEAMERARDNPHPSLVWVIADTGGHIGKQSSGWFPRRRSDVSGLWPVPAWETRNHWKGWREVTLLPCEYDPPRGYVSSANEDINLPGEPPLISLMLPDYRKRRIDERLAELPAATVEDMQHLQYDVVSVQARDLLPVFLPHLPDGALKEQLAEWDCSYGPDSTGASLFQQLYRNVLLEIFGHEEGIGWRRMLYICTRIGYSTMVLTCIDRLLQKEESSWWAVRGKGNLIHRAAERVSAESPKPWSEINSFHFVNRFFEGRRVGHVLGFHTAEMPMPGCHATPFQGHLLATATRETSFAPSYHFVTDMGVDEAWSNLPGGPSESRFSKWYKCDIPLWASGEYKHLIPALPEDG